MVEFEADDALAAAAVVAAADVRVDQVVVCRTLRQAVATTPDVSIDHRLLLV